MLDWLHRMKQTPGAIDRFWRVVLVSALDEELGRMDARYGIDVFWKAFLANRSGYRIGIPSVPLGELYEGCRGAIAARGGRVRTRAGVREIRLCEGKFVRTVLEDGSEISADACISAVPHSVLLSMVPGELGEEEGPLAGLKNIRTSPITGVHLWFDRTVMTEPFLALLEHTTQWIFNKSLLHAASGSRKQEGLEINAGDGGTGGQGQYLQLVISASYELVPMSRQEIIDLCLRELADVLPATRGGEAGESHGNQGNSRHVFARAGRGPLASRAANRRRESVPCGRLDADRLARDDGRRGAQRLSGGGSCARRIRKVAQILASRICRSRVCLHFGPKRASYGNDGVVRALVCESVARFF